MANLVETDGINLDEIADLVSPTGERDRSKPHVTDLITAAEGIATGKKPPDYSGLVGLAAFGKIWEAAALRKIEAAAPSWGGAYLLHPLVLERDGIIGSLDGLLIQQDDNIVVECKLKFGRNANPLEETKWMRQTKAYCWMCEATLAWFEVGCILSGPPRVVGTRYVIQFEHSELAENWQMLLNTKGYLERNRV